MHNSSAIGKVFITDFFDKGMAKISTLAPELTDFKVKQPGHTGLFVVGRCDQ